MDALTQTKITANATVIDDSRETTENKDQPHLRKRPCNAITDCLSSTLEHAKYARADGMTLADRKGNKDIDVVDDDSRNSRAGSEPGSSGEEADIDSCSNGSGTAESVLRRAHRLRVAVVCKDGHVPPEGQQYEGDCIVASRLMHLWTLVPVSTNDTLPKDQQAHTPTNGDVAVSC